jgi:predicted O-linked N-acetylglucosamine transferase (SPINDLY family)
MTWLGYPNTTGLPTMDYRIVDAITDPPAAEASATEQLLRLEGCFLGFTPAATAPEPKLSPFLEAARTSDIRHPRLHMPLTFGSFNRLSKVRPAITHTWAKILARVPNSRLFLKSNLVSDDVKAHYNAVFLQHGVTPERILWSSYLPAIESHLAAYHNIDIALDSFPYHGTTTTCEATWMGVPVITLAGDHHRSRVGASLLTALGLQSHVAYTHDEYIDKAVTLANDTPRLLDLHTTLRARMAQSLLCDTRAYAANVESALRAAWREWCMSA